MPEAIEFLSAKKRARLHDPRKGFEAVEVESEVRRDPLTGNSARICHFALAAPRSSELSEMVRGTGAQCPFCPERIETVTPRFPEELVPGGRLRRGGALVFPNLFPYDDVSAIAALCPEHFHAMDAVPERVVVDGLTAARDFLRLGAQRFGAGEGYGIVTWNYMPPAGASQVHPHMQVVATADPGNALRRELAAAQDWRARTGRPFAEALLERERGGPRWVGEHGGIAWLVPFAPYGLLGDAMALFPGRVTVTDLSDAEIAGFASGLVRVLRGFAAQGFWSFNLCLMPDAFGSQTGSETGSETGTAGARHWLVARLLPRFYLNPALHISDASYMHLLLEERLAMIYPEEVAARLRDAWLGPGQA